MGALSYTRKGPEIETFKFEYGSTNLAELIVWLNTDTIGDFEAWPSTTGPAVVIAHDTLPVLNVSNGEHVAKDSNGKIFKIQQPLLDAFYDLTA